MRRKITFSISCALMTLLFTACEKEGSVGPQGPQGPPGNPGQLTGGSGAAGEVRAYIYNKPLAWKSTGGTPYGTYYLVPSSFTNPPANFRFTMSEDSVLQQDVILYYLDLTGPGNLSAHLPYVFQPSATAPTESYRAVEGYDSGHWTFRVLADIAVAIPYYSVKSLRVIVIPSSSVVIIGGRSILTDKQISLAEAMSIFNLNETDFKIVE